MTPISVGVAQASPSLALVKYWGKSDSHANLPATPSIAVTLENLISETRVWALKPSLIGRHVEDQVWLDGEHQEPGRFERYFEGLRSVAGHDVAFWAESANNFPTAAGLASSSSGFAALTIAACEASGYRADDDLLSSISRLGSGSAARSLYGGFTLLPAASESAEQLHPAGYWPELRIVVVRIHDGPKDLSSRDAMERTRLTSPYYDSWVLDAQKICAEARLALERRDLEGLGTLMRLSYMRMFATMFAARDPIVYWKPESLRTVHLCQELRKRGVAAWETMDAGPQVKILTVESDVPGLVAEITAALGEGRTIVDSVGKGPRRLKTPKLLSGQPPAELLGAAKAIGIELLTDI